MPDRILGAYQTTDGRWRVEAYAARGAQWYRILHDGEVYVRDGHPCEREPLGTVEAILRDNGVDMAELAPEVSE